MERELSRRCRRCVRVAEFVTVGAAASSSSSTVRTGNGSGAASAEGDRTPLFAGYVEVLHARNAWLAVRVDIWTIRDTCFRQGANANANANGSNLGNATLINQIMIQYLAVKAGVRIFTSL